MLGGAAGIATAFSAPIGEVPTGGNPQLSEVQMKKLRKNVPQVLLMLKIIYFLGICGDEVWFKNKFTQMLWSMFWKAFRCFMNP